MWEKKIRIYNTPRVLNNYPQLRMWFAIFQAFVFWLPLEINKILLIAIDPNCYKLLGILS